MNWGSDHVTPGLGHPIISYGRYRALLLMIIRFDRVLNRKFGGAMNPSAYVQPRSRLSGDHAAVEIGVYQQQSATVRRTSIS